MNAVYCHRERGKNTEQAADINARKELSGKCVCVGRRRTWKGVGGGSWKGEKGRRTF